MKESVFTVIYMIQHYCTAYIGFIHYNIKCSCALTLWV